MSGNNTYSLNARRQDMMRKAAAALPEIPVEYWPYIKGKKAREVWRAFCSARATWLPHELLILARIVAMEMQIRDLDAQLLKNGNFASNSRGDLVPSPEYTLREKIIRLQLTIMRQINLVTNTSNMQTEARAIEDARSVIKTNAGNSLLAR